MPRYADAFLETLEENRPDEYQRLRASGQLLALAQEVQERAEAQFDSLMAAFQRQHPLPETYLERVQALYVMESQARELVMDEVLVRGPDEEDR